MKYLTVLFAWVLISSCCGLHTEVKYEYQNVVLTRIDECGITTLYYGNDTGEKYGKIWMEYSGINDGFDGYVKFEKGGKITIMSSDGLFKSENLNLAYFVLDDDFSYSRPEIGDSICYIALSTSYEKENNAKGKTGVDIEYDIDDNEWW